MGLVLLVSVSRLAISMDHEQYRTQLYKEAHANVMAFFDSVAPQDLAEHLRCIELVQVLLFKHRWNVLSIIDEQIRVWHDFTPIKDLFRIEYELEILLAQKKMLLSQM